MRRETSSEVRDILLRRLQRGDLDSHLIVVMDCFGLQSPSVSPLFQALSTTSASDDLDTRSAPQTALVGCRIALGLWHGPVLEFLAAAEREAQRRPLQPLPSIHDDERLMLGVAAGVGATPSRVRDLLLALVRTKTPRSLRAHCVNVFAQWLLLRGTAESTEASRNAARYIESALVDRRIDGVADVLATYWVVSHLIRLSHTDVALHVSDVLCRFRLDCNERIVGLLEQVDSARGLDLAFGSLAPTEPTIDSSAPGPATVAQTAQEALAVLLQSCFTDPELRRFISTIPGIHRPLADQLPGPTSTVAQLAFDAALLVEREGVLSLAFTHLRSVRSHRSGEIEAVRRRYPNLG